MTISVHFDPPTLIARARADTGWFLSPDDVKALAAHPLSRLWPLLIRFDEGRCSAPAQDVETLIAAAERGGWHCRDVALVAGESYGGAVTR